MKEDRRLRPEATRRGRRRLLTAAAAAVLLHGLALQLMGRAVPGVWTPPPDDNPAMQLTLEPRVLDLSGRPRDRTAAPRAALRPLAGDSPLAGAAEPSVRLTAPGEAAPPPPPTRDFPGFFQGSLAGCGREDVILLTTDERLRCRDAIETERRRRAEAESDRTRAARIEAARSAPRIDIIPAEKRAAYDAAVAQRQRTGNDFRMQDLARIQGARGLSGKDTGIDVNVHAGCSIALGAGGGGKLNCPTGRPAQFP